MLNKIKIGPKLIGGYLIVAMIIVGVAVLGYTNMRTINEYLTNLYQKNLIPLDKLAEINAQALQLRGDLYKYLVAVNERESIEKSFEKNIAKTEKFINEFQETDLNKNEKDVFEKLLMTWKSFENEADKVITECKSNKEKDAIDRMLEGGSASEARNHLVTNIDELIKINKEDALNQNNEGQKTFEASTTMLLISSICAVLLAIVLGIALTLSLTKPLARTVEMIQELNKGRLGRRLKINSKDEIGIMAATMDQFADDLQTVIVGTMQKIADGELSANVIQKDEHDEISPALKNTIDSLRGLVAEAGMLQEAAVKGNLSTRGNADNFKGAYKEIVKGVNDCLNAVINPLNVAAKYVDDISKGTIPTKITDNYNGDFNTIKNNLNQCIDAVNALVTDANLLSKAAVEGKLATRADASKHTGDFRKIVQGVDDCLDAVIGPLNVAAKYVDDISKGNIPAKITDNYNGDFNTIKNNLNQCIEAVNMLVKDANMLAQAGIDGRLATRADATKHNGDFRKIVEGVNGTLDAVITPINEAQSVLEKVAARDLTARVCGEYNGDMAKIKIAINSAVDNLDKALQQVTEATEQVTSASGQISSGSQSLAQGANEQASSLEEVSSSLEEMESMTKQNAGNANQAKGLAAESDSNAKSGAEAMDRMSNAINRIKESSDQTAKIVKTIDEIAMQTNLLALNAAVEAARAGEAGRGFAVVAEEVRNLAQRSAQAAKNTADMITESVKNADDGVKIALEVSQSFETIAGSAKKVNELITEIAAASQEQSAGIEQINTAVAQMDKVTQQNAANSEESASAAEELSSQAEELKNMISQFALSQSAMSVSTSRRPVATQTVIHAPLKEKHSLKSIGKKPSGKTASIRPEDIIPLDDEALKEF